jgi:flagellar protein FliS
MANPYLEMELRTASPEVLIGRLLDRAVAKVRVGISELERHPLESTRAVAKAVDIVSELRGALDFDASGELAGNLDSLYEFAAERLVLGSAATDPKPLGEALQVIETLAEGWSELLAQREGSDG